MPFFFNWMYSITTVINIDLFLINAHMYAFWWGSNAIIYIVLSLFTELMLEHIIGLPYLLFLIWRLPNLIHASKKR